MVFDNEFEANERLTALDFKRLREAKRNLDPERNQSQLGTQTSEPAEPCCKPQQELFRERAVADWDGQVSFGGTNQSSVVEESLAQIDASFLADTFGEAEATPSKRGDRTHTSGTADFPWTVTRHMPFDAALRQHLLVTLRFPRYDSALQWLQAARRLWSLLPLAGEDLASDRTALAAYSLARALTYYRYPVVVAGSENRRAWSQIARYAAPYRALHGEAFRSPSLLRTTRDRGIQIRKSKPLMDPVCAAVASAGSRRHRIVGLSAEHSDILLNDLAGWRPPQTAASDAKEIEWWRQRVHQWQRAFLSLFQQFRGWANRQSGTASPSCAGFHVLGDHYAAIFFWFPEPTRTVPDTGFCDRSTQKSAPNEPDDEASRSDKLQHTLAPYALLSHTTERVRKLLRDEFDVDWEEPDPHRRSRTPNSFSHLPDGVRHARFFVPFAEKSRDARESQLAVRGGSNVQGLFEFLLHFGPWLFSNTDVPLLVAPCNMPFLNACLSMPDCTVTGIEPLSASGNETPSQSDAARAFQSTSLYTVQLELVGLLSPFALSYWEAFLALSGATAAQFIAKVDPRTLLARDHLIGITASDQESGSVDAATKMAELRQPAWQTLEAWLAADEGGTLENIESTSTAASSADWKWHFRSSASKQGQTNG